MLIGDGRLPVQTRNTSDLNRIRMLLIRLRVLDDFALDLYNSLC